MYVNNDSNFYSNNYNVSNVSGDELVVRFHGTNAKIYGKKGPDCGKIDVYVDDVFQQTIDLYSSTTTYKALLYDTGTISHGSHHIRFTIRSDKNIGATDKKVYLDYWQYTNVVETIAEPTIKKAYSSQGNLHIEWKNVISGGVENDTRDWAPNEAGAGYYVMWGTNAGIYNHKIDVGYTTKVDLGLQEGIQDNTTYYVKVVPYTPERKDGIPSTATAYYTSCPTEQTMHTYRVPQGNIKVGQPFELGTEFYTTVPGYITKVRFYKSTQEGAESGNREHNVTIYNETDGTVLFPTHQWTVPNTKEGWYEYILPQPVKVVPSKIYTVSVSTIKTADNNCRYMYKSGMFSSPIKSGNIVALRGVYGATLGSRPDGHTETSYFRDVVFVPDLGQSISSGQSAASAYTYPNRGEWGTVFKTNVDGQITQALLYTFSSEGGEHEVRIWRNSDNVCIAGPYTWTFDSGITGWRSFALPETVKIAANTDYTISISSSSDKIVSYANQYFSNPVNNGNLITYTGSGVFTYTLGARPTSVDNNNSWWRDIVFVPYKQQNIFKTDTPAASYTYGAQLEAGTVFKSNTAGTVTAVRIYADAFESGVHKVRIWRNSDNALVVGSYDWNITPGTLGWKEFTLPTPLSILANTDYTVVVSTSSDKTIVYTQNYFDSPVNNGNIITYSGSGVYTYTLGTRPTTVDYYSSWFRDIVFVPN